MSGSLSSLKLKGMPFDVANDADINETIGAFVNSIIQTSGAASISQEARSQDVTGVIIIMRPGDRKIIEDLINSGVAFSISYKHRDGTAYKCKGTINAEGNTTMQNRCTLNLLPTTKWTEFL